MTSVTKWISLKNRVEKVVKASETGDSVLTNKVRRSLYAEVELFKLEWEEKECDYIHKHKDEIDRILKLLDLKPVSKRNAPIIYWVDVVFRFIGVVAGFITLGIILPIPIIVLRMIDYILLSLGILTPFNLMSGYVRRFLSKFLLVLSGVEVEVTTEDSSSNIRDYFDASCSILTFSHSSNLDGFLVSGSCPIPHYAIAKKELFVVPFFSWLSFAIGGVPIDRKNADKAISAIKDAANTAQGNKSCLVIAPEGTRSTTGQLLPFKKGVFYQWELLKVPIIPFVSYGGYDLYPVGSWVNQCGKIYVKYLKPIMPTEAKTREEMHRILKRRMLLAMMDCPDDVARPITWGGRFLNIVATLSILFLDYFSILYLHELLFIEFQYDVWMVLAYFVAGSFGITFVLYVYFVYIVDMMRPRVKVDESKKTS